MLAYVRVCLGLTLEVADRAHHRNTLLALEEIRISIVYHMNISSLRNHHVFDSDEHSSNRAYNNTDQEDRRASEQLRHNTR